MLRFMYAFVLMLSLIGMIILDHKLHLAYFYNRKRTFITVLLGVLIFILWDLLGIHFGIFFSGNSKYMTGWYIVKDFPVEELLFLIFLNYFALVLYRLGEEKWQNT